MKGAGQRYLFIGGLHHTGAGLLADLLARHPDIAAIEDAPVPGNDGCYLQGAIPHTARHGMPGHYATDSCQHLTENSAYNSLETCQRLKADWDPWFDQERPWRLENSPVNLTRMRLYQQLFPLSQFVAILRHPMAMAASLAQETGQKESDLWDYALEAYATIAGDLPFLHAVMVLRYEDLVRDPERTMRALHLFLDLPHHPLEVKLRDANAEFDMQGEFTPLQAVCAEQWGYGDLGSVEPFQPIVEHPLRECRAAVRKCLGLENPPPRAESGARNRRERAFSHSDS